MENTFIPVSNISTVTFQQPFSKYKKGLKTIGVYLVLIAFYLVPIFSGFIRFLNIL